MNAPRMASLVAVLAVTTSACSGYVADTSIAPGDRVRVTAPSMNLRKGVGTVAALESDTLVVDTEEHADALELPFASLTKLEVSRGQKSQSAKGAIIGALVGAAVGAGVGAGAGLSLGEEDCSSGCVAQLAGGGALAGGAAGTLAGLTIGASFKSDRWETVPLDDIRVGLSPVTPDGVAVSVAFPLRL